MVRRSQTLWQTLWLAPFALAASAWAAQTLPASHPLANPVAPAVEVGPETRPLLAQYRIFIESVTFGGTDPAYRGAEYSYRPQLRDGEAWSSPIPVLMGPGFKAKDLPLKSRKPVPFGMTYYFPIAMKNFQAPRIEGELTLSAYAGGALPTRKYTETFRVSLDRQSLGRSIDAKGDRGSVVRLKLMSMCDFNIYETNDLTAVRKYLRADLESAGGRVFDERGDRSLFSRPTNAVWIGSKAPEECVQIAIKTFSLKYSIPIKGVFAMGTGHHSKWYFNPYGVTLGYARELDQKPELPRALMNELTKPGARARAAAEADPTKS